MAVDLRYNLPPPLLVFEVNACGGGVQGSRGGVMLGRSLGRFAKVSTYRCLVLFTRTSRRSPGLRFHTLFSGRLPPLHTAQFHRSRCNTVVVTVVLVVVVQTAVLTP